jgi:DNA-binding CsgD family transcriptional regulator
LAVSTLDEKTFQDYNDFYHKISPFRRKLENMKAGEVFRRSEHCSDEVFEKSEIYQECYQKNDTFYFDYQVLFKNSDISGGITFSRPKSMENFSTEEYQAISLITPHIGRAFQVYYNLNQVEHKNQILSETLNRISQNILIVNKNGKIVYANDSALELISKKDGLQIDKRKQLVADLSHDTKKLRKLLQSVFKPDIKNTISHGGSMQLSRPSGLRDYSIVITPIKDEIIKSFGSKSNALVFILDPEEKVETVNQILSDLYDLTKSEARIAGILAEGKSLQAACTLLKIKKSTARTHLKRIFSKTNTHRQSELVSLILTGPANIKSI